ncbi:GL23538 [Drosophila persimilis]|uniref:GL23538 n=1 Tax=Drosophila persimilis TaxID=7234 RepID=B4G2V9_DROPE|nr:GL23538 [Drosophila persimilis]
MILLRIATINNGSFMSLAAVRTLAPRKAEVQKKDVQVSLGLQVRDGSIVFGVFTSPLIALLPAKVKADCDEASPYSATTLGITAVNIKMRATWQNGNMSHPDPVPSRSSMKMGRTEDVNPIPSDFSSRKGGRPCL